MAAENVPNDELLRDIENTKLEIKAHEDISRAFMVLAALPENTATQRMSLLAEKHKDYAEQCRVFLGVLEGLAQGRALDIPEG